MNTLAKPRAVGLREWLADDYKAKAIDNAVSGWMPPEQFKAQILIALNHEDLAVCTEQSKFKAAHECAALSLLPNVGHVALIPRKRREDGRVVAVEVHVQLQWQGMKSLMERNEEVLDVSGYLVHEGDQFHWSQATNQLTHEFDPFGDRSVDKELSKIRGGYLIVTYSDARRPQRYHFISRTDILKRKACAETSKIWDKWPYEQALKTVYRDAYARRVVPIDPLVGTRMQKAVDHDDGTLANDPDRVADAPDEQPRHFMQTGLIGGPRSRTEALASEMQTEHADEAGNQMVNARAGTDAPPADQPSNERDVADPPAESAPKQDDPITTVAVDVTGLSGRRQELKTLIWQKFTGEELDELQDAMSAKRHPICEKLYPPDYEAAARWIGERRQQLAEMPDVEQG